jgi:carnitine O-acetyltransferase
LFQAYLHGVRSGHIPMPSVALPSQVSKAQPQGNHSRTISDAKKGVTFAGQDQLQKLPIPTLEETCERYLRSVRPFLVRQSVSGG